MNETINFFAKYFKNVIVFIDDDSEYWNIRCAEEYRDRILSGDWE